MSGSGGGWVEEGGCGRRGGGVKGGVNGEKNNVGRSRIGIVVEGRSTEAAGVWRRRAASKGEEADVAEDAGVVGARTTFFSSEKTGADDDGEEEEAKLRRCSSGSVSSSRKVENENRGQAPSFVFRGPAAEVVVAVETNAVADEGATAAADAADEGAIEAVDAVAPVTRRTFVAIIDVTEFVGLFSVVTAVVAASSAPRGAADASDVFAVVVVE